ncbi:N-acetyltransferase family protein [Streptococcus dentapri]|uniref:GNAT family N-acetyltransferase n=1 Tax=Streptococcus dentapri TaxID=573564 RepID=A0ABV8D1V6_9STRE
MPIRRAKLDDIPILEKLLEDILLVHHEVRPDLFKASGKKFSHEELEALIPDDSKPIFVYENEAGQVLGHLFTIIEKHEGPTKPPHKTLFIDDLCVASEARGQKIGQQLYEFAHQYAKEIGCYNLTLHVWNANEAALRFYKNQGLQEQYTSMEEIL